MGGGGYVYSEEDDGCVHVLGVRKKDSGDS